jgi:hypothetical protein
MSVQKEIGESIVQKKKQKMFIGEMGAYSQSETRLGSSISTK